MRLPKTFSIALLLGWSLAASAAEVIHGSGVIHKVVDGDTYWIRIDRSDVWRDLARQANNRTAKLKNKTIKTRIVNINTEESVHRQAAKNTLFGKLTSSIVKQDLQNKPITFACKGVGRYKRPLCSIYIDGDDYGLSLVRRGLSRYITRYGRHFSSHKQYVFAEREARRLKLGVWGSLKEQYAQSLLSTLQGKKD